MDSRSAQVIVVGGGPAGAATAFHLARAGVHVTILDRAHFPRDKPCSEYMSPQASRILDAMGVLERIERAGAAHLAGMRVRAPNGATFHGRFADVEDFRGYRDRGLALRRTILDNLLLDRARAVGAIVREGVRVTTLRRDATGRVTGVDTIDGDGKPCTLAASIVVGADGLRSIVARRLALAATKLAQRRVAFVTHFAGIDMGDSGEMHVERDGYLGLADVGGGMTNVAVVVPRSRAREASGDPAAFVDAWIGRRRHVAPRFAGAVRVTPVLATGPFASAARRACAPGVALVGDAADFFDPFTGEGIYAALRGAELLAPRIVDALAATTPVDQDASLRAYDRERIAEFRGKWAVERIIGVAVTFPAVMNVAARSLALRPHMAHTIVGVTGDFVPAREVLRPGFLLRLLVPPLVLVCVDRVASMHEMLLRASHFAVNILAAHQEALSRRFSGPDEHKRFDGVGYSRGQSGAALLDDALAHLECRRVAHHDAGDHTVVIGEVESATAFPDRPLLYYRGGYAQLER